MTASTMLPRVASLAAVFGVTGTLSAEMSPLKYRTFRNWDVVLPKEQFTRVSGDVSFKGIPTTFHTKVTGADLEVDHDGDGVMEFAASFLSSEGVRDGLVWTDEDSPLGERIALASLDGYSNDEGDQAPEPFGGYYYRILQGQSASAPGGAMDYVIGGNMVAGHALLAVPSDYGNSGVQSFMVSENGTVLEADLGEDSLTIAFGMTRFEPGSDWTPVE